MEKASSSGSFWTRWSLSVEDRLRWIYRIILVGLSIQMLLSWPLWWKTNGVLSYLPIFFSGQWVEKSSLILFPVFLITVLFLFLFPKKSGFHKFLFFIGFLLVLGNIHRVQVWFYFYGILLFLFFWRKTVSAETLSWTIRLVIAGLYCWSGIHKFNIHFVEDIFPWFIEPLGWTSRNWLAYGAGGVELLIGIGLLVPFTRNLSVFGCLTFHGIILGILGPLGHNWNMVVWPWNLVMPSLVFLLFYKTPNIGLKNIGSVFRLFLASAVALTLVWLLPVFNYLGFTPEQLSFKMYAGSQPEAVLYFGEKDRNLVADHPTVHGVLPSQSLPTYRVLLDDLAFTEWGTPLFTTEYTVRRVASQFCQKMSRPEEGGVLYLVDDDFMRISCEELIGD